MKTSVTCVALLCATHICATHILSARNFEQKEHVPLSQEQQSSSTIAYECEQIFETIIAPLATLNKKHHSNYAQLPLFLKH